MNSAFGEPSGLPSVLRVSLDDVRNLELRHTCARPETIELVVEYAGGPVKVFKVDRFLIERLLEHLEQMADEETARGR